LNIKSLTHTKRNLVTLLFLVAITLFSACSEAENLNTTPVDELVFTMDNDCEVKEVAVKFVGKLHRGRKWSERNNVKPCTQSFGICNFKFKSVPVKIECKSLSLGKSLVDCSGDFDYEYPGEETTTMAFHTIEDPGFLRLYFKEAPKDYQQGVFISSESENIEIPTCITTPLDYTGVVEIIADNYI
jgi:hypothetical protein